MKNEKRKPQDQVDSDVCYVIAMQK